MADEEQTLDILELDSNLGDIEKPPELPPGNYTGEIQDVQTGVSQKGNTYYNIKFMVPPAEIPADIAEQFEDGVPLYYNRIIKPKKGDRRALYNLRRFIEAIGLDSNTTTIDPNEWMGQSARLKVVHETYQGETRAVIKSVESAEAPKSKTPTKAAAAPAKTTRGARK